MEGNGTVRTLENDVSRHIATSQVVATLMGACRELIDNALDAGATSVADSVATKLIFSADGEIADRSVCSRQCGTTVTIADLFKRLPVRRKDLERNAKSEMQKLLGVVQSFALSRTDVRFSVTNQLGQKLNKSLMTPGNGATLSSVITSLFGLKAGKNEMLEIKEMMPDEEIMSLYGLTEKDTETIENVKISGYVSACDFGCGRYSADRQFVYVNKRPVDYTQLCKVANEVYRSYNKAQFCTLVVFIEVDPAFVDVNVTPDKRIVLLRNQNEAFARFRASLITTFEAVLGRCPRSDLLSTTQTQFFDNKPEISVVAANDSFDIINLNESATVMPQNAKRKNAQFGTSPVKKKTATLESFNFIPHAKPNPPDPKSTVVSIGAGSSKSQMSERRIPTPTKKDMIAMMTVTGQTDSASTSLTSDFLIDRDLRNVEADIQQRSQNSKRVTLIVEDRTPTQNPSLQNTERRPASIIQSPSVREIPKKKNLESDSQSCTFSDHVTVLPSTDMLETRPVESAERNLTLMLQKSDFNRMRIVGQFNNAFILTRLDNEMFIVDQHASDEKFNFEQLQQNARIRCQPMIAFVPVPTLQFIFRPKAMHLGIDELIVFENQQIFKANGFDFEYRENEELGRRVYLKAVPVVHGFQFEQSDVEEIIEVLKMTSITMYRPRKLHKIFASRACRKSIMFGDALSRQQMTRVIRHMATMDRPWQIKECIRENFAADTSHGNRTSDMFESFVISNLENATCADFWNWAACTREATPYILSMNSKKIDFRTVISQKMFNCTKYGIEYGLDTVDVAKIDGCMSKIGKELRLCQNADTCRDELYVCLRNTMQKYCGNLNIFEKSAICESQNFFAKVECVKKYKCYAYSLESGSVRSSTFLPLLLFLSFNIWLPN